ncbi:50S ribosomal protein L19e [Candidatus Woesearchaeota archaeon]|nr:50S ribosomal protein L19e [Candidatus Woesearchaeota archaeon]
MKLTLQKRLAASVMKCSPKKVTFDPASLEDIKEAITKQDIRSLIGEGIIKIAPDKGVSRARANKTKRQKRKGLRRGVGTRKGKKTARTPKKRAWMNRVRSQRNFLKRILEKGVVTHDIYKDLYAKVGGGFFRSVKHIQIFMDERSLVSKDRTVKGSDASASASPAKATKPKAAPKKAKKQEE